MTWTHVAPCPAAPRPGGNAHAAPPSPHTSSAWSQPKAASVNVSLVQWIGAIVFLGGPTASCTASRTSQRVDHD
jgi:hypothetical protein